MDISNVTVRKEWTEVVVGIPCDWNVIEVSLGTDSKENIMAANIFAISNRIHDQNIPRLIFLISLKESDPDSLKWYLKKSLTVPSDDMKEFDGFYFGVKPN